MQIPGVDYTKKFSPVAQPTTVRIVIVLVLWYEEWDSKLVDIEAAFLKGRLKSSIYIDLPPGLDKLGFISEEDYDDTCIELNGGMYGNPDAALLYFIRFRDYTIDEKGLGLRQSEADPCLFYKKELSGKVRGVIVVYVDNCLIPGDPPFIKEMKEKLKSDFGVVEDGRLKKLLGVRYEWSNIDNPSDCKVTLSMSDKAEEIVNGYEKAVGRTAKVQSTPRKPGEVLTKNDGVPIMHKEYRSVLGKIMFYVNKVGPECSFSCGQLARQMHNPNEEHWKAMERLVGYIKGKEKHELVLTRPKEIRVVSYGDSSYSDCKDTRRSSTGDIHTVGGALVSWRAQKTKCVCLSSTKAEYVELTEMSKEQRFIQMILEEVFENKLPGIMFEDNEAAIFLTKNKHVSPRTKHIDIREHYVREHVDNGYGKIVKIGTDDNIADILTKNTSVGTFLKLSEMLLSGDIDYGGKIGNIKREND